MQKLKLIYRIDSVNTAKTLEFILEIVKSNNYNICGDFIPADQVIEFVKKRHEDHFRLATDEFEIL